MAKAVIVFESMFGDNALVAASIASGLSTEMECDIFEVGEAPTSLEPDTTLLVVGGPNHALGLSRPSSRAKAATKAGQGVLSNEKGAPLSTDIGLREWLQELHPARGIAAAVYDTRLAQPRILRFLDHASRSTAKTLKRLGFRVIAPSAHFFVSRDIGPLLETEQERARLWGMSLARAVGDATVPAGEMPAQT